MFESVEKERKAMQILQDGYYLNSLYYNLRFKRLLQGKESPDVLETKLESHVDTCCTLIALCSTEMCTLSEEKLSEIEHTTKMLKVGVRFLPRLNKKIQGIRTRRLVRLCILLAQCSLSKHVAICHSGVVPQKKFFFDYNVIILCYNIYFF